MWGQETIHIGRYDLVENLEKARGKKMAPVERTLKAQKLHEEYCINKITSLMKRRRPSASQTSVVATANSCVTSPGEAMFGVHKVSTSAVR